MGEAKRRGTKEERVAQAIARNEATKAAANQAVIASRQKLQSRGKTIGLGRLPFGLAIALAAVGSSAFEVGKNEN
ncbi:hypothetical protein L1Z01_20975 [Acinetobacter baumannii]|uniref:Uncharacterized protein n=2 Tax=Acinetobacter baumannii TaxID=470 RepID=A0A506FGZ7_ACIBA|nr:MULTISPECIES: hypothetical protein [Acinetobacter calcoaceticus/baumannii complex]ALJ87448.1 hypothetical protein AN415_01543 [Acinetobacter baumannii]EGJ61822.1 conserved domain protein [Acinetobacter baumannii 6013150]EGJ65373.1 conserved domain protein [Acinetobacter baumannii 6013113]EHU1796270.1 hypothetical protein [Acinetobacter baumannii]EHU2742533.1 hypothetical protein [Acinetobacter baumannii]